MRLYGWIRRPKLAHKKHEDYWLSSCDDAALERARRTQSTRRWDIHIEHARQANSAARRGMGSNHGSTCSSRWAAYQHAH